MPGPRSAGPQWCLPPARPPRVRCRLRCGSYGRPPARRPSNRLRSAGPSSPATGTPCKGAIRSPGRCVGATRGTAICAGSPGSTATPSRSIATNGAAARSARSTDPPAGAGPPGAAMPTSVSSCPPTARRCCQPATPGWNCGARIWSGCSPTARSTPGSSHLRRDYTPGAD